MSASLTTPETIRLTFKWDALEALFPQLLNAPLEVREAFLSGLEAGTEFFRIQSDVPPAAIATEVTVSLEPTDCLVGLLSAAGAGN